MIKQKVAAIIVAAGSSRRMKGLDKIFQPLNRKPILAVTLKAFNDCDAVDQIIVVLSEDNLEHGRKIIKANYFKKVTAVCAGGQRRQDSVKNGLKFVQACDWVMVHDAARPFIDADIIERGLAAARETGAAVAAVPVTDTIKKAGGDMTVAETVSRENLWSVQTPQVFRSDIISEAYGRMKNDVTDDASLVEAMGGKVKIFMGSYDNFKITTPRDLELAKIQIRKTRDAS